MKIELAPLEGVTGHVYRKTFAEYYGGIDHYFTPFLNTGKLSGKFKTEVLPEKNPAAPLTPQILEHNPEIFLRIVQGIQALGYEEVNLNLGCPSKTVVNKGRGAGSFKVMDQVEKDLEGIFSKCPLKVSIKCRIGYQAPENTEEEGLQEAWINQTERMLNIFKQYPVSELIVHPRFGTEFYTGHARMEVFKKITEYVTGIPLTYNGDLNSVEDVKRLQEIVPVGNSFAGDIMIGRGAIANPRLAGKLQREFNAGAGQSTLNAGQGTLNAGIPGQDDSNWRKQFREFHKALVEGYLANYSGERPVVEKMKELWYYWGEFDNAIFLQGASSEKKTLVAKFVKEIRKCKSLAEYQANAGAIMSL